MKNASESEGSRVLRIVIKIKKSTVNSNRPSSPVHLVPCCWGRVDPWTMENNYVIAPADGQLDGGGVVWEGPGGCSEL